MSLFFRYQRSFASGGWAATLVTLLVIAGCSRGTDDRQAAQQRPAADASPIDPVASAQPQMDQQSGVIAESPASSPPAVRATRQARSRAFSHDDFPAMAPDPAPANIEMPMAEPMVTADAGMPQPGEHLSHLPAGAQHHREQGFATVQVFYATDRLRSAVPLSDYEVTGNKEAFVVLVGFSALLVALAAISAARRRTRTGAVLVLAGGMSACLAAALVVVGQANIEKHGVTYDGDRGRLTRGICEVTVPDIHRRGLVERPSLLRFELRENQQEHIVLTSAVELSAGDFNQRLRQTISTSPDRDLLVFIHGYNVDFDSAVRRTAQIAVDLPFEGVPVCYSWPSQGSLIGYSIDENNAQWTVAHLKQFLLELARDSGAESINVIAHSMGNRAMTAAMEQISWQIEDRGVSLFDRIVLAAPDVDADRFRRDFAPSLVHVANQVTLYASSDDQALVASKQVHGYPRAGESGANIVVVPGIETIDVSGIDLSLLGHSYYGDNESMLRDLYEVVRARLPAPQRGLLIPKNAGPLTYWQLAQRQGTSSGLR